MFFFAEEGFEPSGFETGPEFDYMGRGIRLYGDGAVPLQLFNPEVLLTLIGE